METVNYCYRRHHCPTSQTTPVRLRQIRYRGTNGDGILNNKNKNNHHQQHATSSSTITYKQHCSNNKENKEATASSANLCSIRRVKLNNDTRWKQNYNFSAAITLWLLFIISLNRATNCQQNPSIVHITPGQSVDLGDTIDLSCSVQYGANYPIIWTKLSENPNNSPLFISRDAALTLLDNRYSIRHDDSSSTYTLQVSKIQEIDTGTYQCQVVTSATSRITADTFISVRIPPLISDNSSRGLVVAAGDTFTLSCNATGFPTPKISWRRENNGELPTGGVVAKGNSITIYNATKDERGIYYCIADNGVGGKPARRSVGVEIEFAPRVNLVRAKYSQAIGYPVELHCMVEASPAPDISWLKDGYQINDGGHLMAGDNNNNNNAFYHISSTSNSHDFIQSSLRIRRVEQRDLGAYRCRAINKLGDRQTTMVLERADSPVCPPACVEGEFMSVTISAATRSAKCCTLSAWLPLLLVLVSSLCHNGAANGLARIGIGPQLEQ